MRIIYRQFLKCARLRAVSRRECEALPAAIATECFTVSIGPAILYCGIILCLNLDFNLIHSVADFYCLYRNNYFI